MVYTQLTSLKKHSNNILILGLAVWVLMPYAGLTITAQYAQASQVIILFACAYMLLRFVAYHAPALIRQQSTLHLWALHTASRLQNIKYSAENNFLPAWSQRKYFLVVGNKQSGKSTLLNQAQAIEKQLPFEYQQKGLITHSIWTTNSSMLLETTCLMPHNQETDHILKQYWRDLMRICKWQNTDVGFNGVILVLSLQNILSEKQAHPTQSTEALRCQLKNICQSSPHMPIHLVITGLDQLEGFYTFFKYIDKDDTQKPLGFILSPTQQLHGDIQGELDKVANDIEMYLIYMLEKVIQGAQNDVEKMHTFHDAFKALKPRIVQVLYSLKIQVSNPISSIFFTSYNNLDTPLTHSQHQYDQHKSYFSENVIKTINDTTTWQPSRKLQQCALFVLILTAWYQSEISLTQHIIAPIQTQIEHFFNIDKPNEKTIIVRKKPTPKPAAPEMAILNPHDIPATSPETNQAPLAVLTTSAWDNLKPGIDAKVSQCHPFKDRSCLNLSLLLAHVHAQKKLTQRSLNEFDKLVNIGSKPVLDHQTYHLTEDNRIEVDFFIQKLQKSLEKKSELNIARDLLNLIDTNYVDANLEQRLTQSDTSITKACGIMQNLKTALPTSLPKDIPSCQAWITKNTVGKDLNQHITQIDKMLTHYHQSQSFGDFFKKIQYLKENTATVHRSIIQMQKDLSLFEPYIMSMDPTVQQRYHDLALALKQFSPDVYNKVLLQVYAQSKEVMQSKQQGLAALQILDSMIDKETKLNSQLDQLSLNCKQTFESLIIDLAGQYLNKMWQQMIYIPYQNMKDLYPFNAQSNKHVNLDDFHDFFSTDGRISSFNNKYLFNLTSVTKGNGSSWKKLHNKALPFEKNITSFLMATNIVQKMYYPNQATELWFEGILRYRHASKGIKRIHIVQDQSQQTLNPQQTTPIHIKWPHAQDKFALSVTLENGENVVLAQENGPWSMLRFLDKFTNGSTSKKHRILKFSHYDHAVELEFESQNSVTPLSATLESFLQVPTALYHDTK